MTNRILSCDSLGLIREFLNLEDNLQLEIAGHLPINIPSLVARYQPPSCGPKRLRFWRYLLSYRHKCPSFLKPHILPDRVQYRIMSRQYADNASCLSLGQLGEIMRDVSRTFPAIDFFTPGQIGEKLLERILQAVLIARPEVGYCQGMNFIAGVLILARLPNELTGWSAEARSSSLERSSEFVSVFLDSRECVEAEFDVFSMLLLMMDRENKLGMCGLWQGGVPKMKLRVYQLDRLLRWTLPRLHAHFKAILLTPEVIVAQWFITLFSYSAPLRMVFRFWDYVLLEGWPGIYRVALSLLKTMEDYMLQMDLEGFGNLMKRWKSRDIAAFQHSAEEILTMAQAMVITEDVLQNLQESYALEMISLSESALLQMAARARSGSAGSLAKDPYSLEGLQFNNGSNQTPAGEGVATMPSSSSESNDIWLKRYGDVISDDMAVEMLRVRDDLKNMESQVDVDKNYIQNKIIRACEEHRFAQERLETAVQEQMKWLTAVAELTQDFEAALLNAQLIAQAASMDLDDDGSNLSESFVSPNGSPRDFVESVVTLKPDDLKRGEKRNSGWMRSSVEVNLGVTANGFASSNHVSSVSNNDLITDEAEWETRVERIHRQIEEESEEEEGGAEGREEEALSGQHDENVLALVVTGPVDTQRNSQHLIDFAEQPLRIDIPKVVVADVRKKIEDPEEVSSVSLLSSPSQSVGEDDAETVEEGVLLPEKDATRQQMRKQQQLFKHIEMLQKQNHTVSPAKASAEVKTNYFTKNKLLGGVGRMFKMASSISFTKSFARAPSNESTEEPLFGGYTSDLERERRRRHRERMEHLVQQSQVYQQKIISVHRSLEISKAELHVAMEELTAAKLSEEEALERKRSLCMQLQRLMEDANRGRSQKLQYITEAYQL